MSTYCHWPELAYLLADAGVLSVSLSEYDDLPAPMIEQIEAVVGSQIKRRNDESRRAAAIRTARGSIR